MCAKGLWISKGFILLTLRDKFGPIVASVQLPPFNYLTREDKEFTLSITMGVNLSIVTMIVIALNQFNATTF